MAGLAFDADGAGSCPGAEPREFCGTPATVTSGQQTVTFASGVSASSFALVASLDGAFSNHHAKRWGKLRPPNHQAGAKPMKQRVLERARSTVDGFLHRQCADTTLGVLSVNPEVNGYDEDVLLIRFTYDDSNGAKGLPDSLTRIELVDRLWDEFEDADIEASPVVSFIAESEVGHEPE